MELPPSPSPSPSQRCFTEPLYRKPMRTDMAPYRTRAILYFGIILDHVGPAKALAKALTTMVFRCDTVKC